jgi:hypothetical protein
MRRIQGRENQGQWAWVAVLAFFLAVGFPGAGDAFEDPATQSCQDGPVISATTANVKTLWCNNKCTEGHDSGQCLCEKIKGAPDNLESSWVRCYTASCCSHPTVTCGDHFSDVIWYDGNQPGGALPNGRPVNPAGWRYCSKWDDYYYNCVNCMGYDPGYCNAPHCQYLDDIGCWIAPGQSTCTYYSRGGTQTATIIPIPVDRCVRSNETGTWSWASWWSFLSGADTCSLSEQKPWTHSGVNLQCN